MFEYKANPGNKQRTVALLKRLATVIIWAVILGLFIAALRMIANSYPPANLGE